MHKVQKILFAGMSENKFQISNVEVYEKIFFPVEFLVFRRPGKTINFTTYLVYIIISISKKNRPTMRLSYLSVYLKS